MEEMVKMERMEQMEKMVKMERMEQMEKMVILIFHKQSLIIII
jgi:hypothetical protein